MNLLKHGVVTRESIHKHSVEGDQDDKLSNEGQTATGGVDAMSFVELKLFFLQNFGVFAVLFFEGVELGFERGHFPGGLHLRESKGNEKPANDESKNDDSQSQVVAGDLVEPQERVENGFVDESVIHKYSNKICPFWAAFRA